jgi:hypothetical protein
MVRHVTLMMPSWLTTCPQQVAAADDGSLNPQLFFILSSHTPVTLAKHAKHERFQCKTRNTTTRSAQDDSSSYEVSAPSTGAFCVLARVAFEVMSLVAAAK